MFGKRIKRGVPEINATSTADMAFMLLVFFLPLVTAGIHVAAAFPMLCKLLELFKLFDVRLFALCAAGTLLVFCAIYALVYGLTTRTYSRIVGGQ